MRRAAVHVVVLLLRGLSGNATEVSPSFLLPPEERGLVAPARPSALFSLGSAKAALSGSRDFPAGPKRRLLQELAKAQELGM